MSERWADSVFRLGTPVKSAHDSCNTIRMILLGPGQLGKMHLRHLQSLSGSQEQAALYACLDQIEHCALPYSS